ncbi:putative isomerase YbhE [Epithele typhae]|uniref:putative isomerase YbhE n=1 Tax=Epithele typhae TaxID=378194 RepID=UPI00200765E1|nr:putative isomerase YbhE [Epithele typhae]KAH9935149.1 putative isomerase YbhE [Epithele typhae]
MVYHILVASYANEVSTLAFDPDAPTPSLSLTSTISVGHHPSWITPHPTDKSIVFTALEQDDGRLIVFKVGDEGRLTHVCERSTGGKDPCSLVTLSEPDEILVANYSSGAFTAVPITSSPSYISTTSPAPTITFSGTGPNTDRQEASHLHQVAPHPSYPELLVPDLGADKVRRLVRKDGQWEEKGTVDFKPGSGPRHVAFHGDVMYTVLELSSELAAHRLPPLPAPATLLDTVPTMAAPPPPEHAAAMLAAEVLAPPPSAAFPRALVYVSNRNDPSPLGDTIAVFGAVDAGGKIALVREVRSGLKHLRGMVFGGADDRWLVAGGAQGGGVKVFERVEGGAGLKEVASVELEAPTGFLWL